MSAEQKKKRRCATEKKKTGLHVRGQRKPVGKIIQKKTKKKQGKNTEKLRKRDRRTPTNRETTAEWVRRRGNEAAQASPCRGGDLLEGSSEVKKTGRGDPEKKDSGQKKKKGKIGGHAHGTMKLRSHGQKGSICSKKTKKK